MPKILMSLARISRVVVRFHCKEFESRSARDFWARITSGKIQKTNPDCKIESRLLLKGSPSVACEYTNKNTTAFSTVGLTAPQILERLQQLSDQMETSDVLQKVGVAGAQLESGWDSARNAAGTSMKVTPR